MHWHSIDVEILWIIDIFVFLRPLQVVYEFGKVLSPELIGELCRHTVRRFDLNVEITEWKGFFGS